MSLIGTVPSPSPARPLARLAGIVAFGVAQMVKACRHRRDAATLASFDDRMLADIGLTRGDLRDAFAQPLWSDPTSVLVKRVREKRNARHSSPHLMVVVGGRSRRA